MDDADLSQQVEQAIIAAALTNRKPQPVSPDGICIWCEDQPIVANTAFCSAECGVDYHKYHRELRQRNSGD
ncbi:hypothetical protein [Pantoea sp. C2G6]|uniref:hypothetical protein n=1 Tax=Pantoea sp. C2G6 TaxID=3243084 RepID=UPI003ED923BA